MLVTFHSSSHADILMFGDIALRLLQLMGHSGTVPGALLAEDLPAALHKLKQGLDEVGAETPSPNGKPDKECAENRVRLDLRAKPLIEMLEAAIADEGEVMWD